MSPTLRARLRGAGEQGPSGGDSRQRHDHRGEEDEQRRRDMERQNACHHEIADERRDRGQGQSRPGCPVRGLADVLRLPVQVDPCALARGRLQVGVAADLLEPFLDGRDQATADHGVRVEALTIVADLDVDPAALLGDRDFGLVDTRVPLHVVQRLAHSTGHGVDHVGWQRGCRTGQRHGEPRGGGGGLQCAEQVVGGAVALGGVVGQFRPCLLTDPLGLGCRDPRPVHRDRAQCVHHLVVKEPFHFPHLVLVGHRGCPLVAGTPPGTDRRIGRGGRGLELIGDDRSCDGDLDEKYGVNDAVDNRRARHDHLPGPDSGEQRDRRGRPLDPDVRFRPDGHVTDEGEHRPQRPPRHIVAARFDVCDHQHLARSQHRHERHRPLWAFTPQDQRQEYECHDRDDQGQAHMPGPRQTVHDPPYLRQIGR